MNYKEKKKQLLDRVDSFPKIELPEQIAKAEELIAATTDLITEAQSNRDREILALKLKERAILEEYNYTELPAKIISLKKKISKYVNSFQGVQLTAAKISDIDKQVLSIQEKTAPIAEVIETADKKDLSDLEIWFGGIGQELQNKTVGYVSLRRDYLRICEKINESHSPSETNLLTHNKNSKEADLQRLRYNLIGHHHEKIEQLENQKKHLLEEKNYVEKKMGGKKITYTFVVNDNSKLKGTFAKLTPDKEAIKNFIRENESRITDGMELDGVTFNAYYTNKTIHP